MEMLSEMHCKKYDPSHKTRQNSSSNNKNDRNIKNPFSNLVRIKYKFCELHIVGNSF